MPTPLPRNEWMYPDPPDLPAASPLANVPAPAIKTVSDYIAAHDLHVVLAIEGFLDLPIDAVAVEHDELSQMTYFTQNGSAIGTAAWSQPEQT